MDAEPVARRPHTLRVAVGTDPIDSAALLDEVSDPVCGATALFLGTVRDHSPGKSGVTHLDYEAYEEEVENKIVEIVEEAAERWPIVHTAVVHRTGVVEVRQASVAVAVSAPHRADAFDAARYVIDELKVRAPIWKKEHWDGGEAWSRGS
jgi:molybdopterin synthase catalytic subunit